MPSSASPGIPPEPPAANGPAVVPGLLQRHGTGGRGHQPAPPQGASDKTSGSVSTSMPSSASPGISPEPPAVSGPLPGDDETARLPSLVSRLPPLAASKRPAGALSPYDVALFQTFPCTAECCLKEASHTPSASRQPNLRTFRPLRRALLSARGGHFIPFLDPTPPNEGGGRKRNLRGPALILSQRALVRPYQLPSKCPTGKSLFWHPPPAHTHFDWSILGPGITASHVPEQSRT